jgi:uncharacterized membrane protein
MAANRNRARLLILDVVRGLAIAGVVVYHLVWDLDFTGLLPSGIARQPAWIFFARTLAGTFMLLVGVNLVLAHDSGLRWQAFARRLGVIVLAALAISVVTKFAFAQTFIYFGILHAIAAASLIGVLFLRRSVIFCVVAGLVTLILPHAFRNALFNTRWLAWIGFAEAPPVSNDLVPVFPWVGLTLLGMALARLALQHSVDDWLKSREPGGQVVQSLSWLGRHSLAIYLVHQPVLLALIVPLATWIK